MNKTKFLPIFFLAAALLSFPGHSEAAENKTVKVKIKKKEAVKIFPDFPEKAQWINGKKPGKNFFKDKITLVYFWDYNSINCIRELKALKGWADYYRPYRFQVLWVHAPEFSAGSDSKNIESAVKRFSLKGPVLLDNKFLLWDALNVKAWPAKVLVNEDKSILLKQSGEGQYFDVETKLRSALKQLDPGIVLPPPIFKKDIEAYNPLDCGEMTSETYLGYKKSNWWGAKLGNKQWLAENETRLLHDQGDRAERGFFLEGLWVNRAEFLEHARGTQGISDYAGLLYLGREVYVVAGAEKKNEENRVYVTRDDAPVPPGYQGADLRMDEKGETYFLAQDPRLYYLIEGEDSATHELKLWTEAKGVQLYSFSFSNLCLADFDHL